MPHKFIRGICCAVSIVVLLGPGSGCSGAGAGAGSNVVQIAEPPLSASAEPMPRGHRPVSMSSVIGRTSATARDLRVMSFNVRVAIFIDALNHWGFRKDLLVDTIRNFDPDLLGTQEALASQSDYLRDNLRDYAFVGAGRNDGKRRGEMCGVFFKRDRFDQLEQGHFWLSETPNVPGSKDWGSANPRMVTWVKLRDRYSGSRFCFFNTHFDHRGRRAREESAKLLRQKIVQIAGSLPVIVTGDFNTDEDTTPYRTLVNGQRAGATKLVDTFRIFDRTPDNREGTRHGFGGSRRGPRIDWILASPTFQTTYAAIDYTREGGRYPSDHFPVTAIVRPAPAPSMAQIE